MTIDSQDKAKCVSLSACVQLCESPCHGCQTSSEACSCVTHVDMYINIQVPPPPQPVIIVLFKYPAQGGEREPQQVFAASQRLYIIRITNFQPSWYYMFKGGLLFKHTRHTHLQQPEVRLKHLCVGLSAQPHTLGHEWPLCHPLC